MPKVLTLTALFNANSNNKSYIAYLNYYKYGIIDFEYVDNSVVININRKPYTHTPGWRNGFYHKCTNCSSLVL